MRRRNCKRDSKNQADTGTKPLQSKMWEIFAFRFWLTFVYYRLLFLHIAVKTHYHIAILLIFQSDIRRDVCYDFWRVVEALPLHNDFVSCLKTSQCIIVVCIKTTFCLALCQVEDFLDCSARYFTKSMPNLRSTTTARNITHKYSTRIKMFCLDVVKT
jgi:hypothetical protein